MEVESWEWGECPKCHFGQRINPELLNKGATPFCPKCDIELKIS